ncbi:phosphatidylglycerol lysyltransferase domain-containing protein [Niabella sp. CJ426]|uniref:phosphatidylglycerol lysyltransferase domain-containing protein n=1 Tax=Niabella sp. CJ426 TaxID=3393740 RepID=UPI003D013F4E
MQTTWARFSSLSKKISPKAHWRELVALLVILLAIFFFRSERKELHQIVPQLQQVGGGWLLLLSVLGAGIIFCQAGMYHQSFAAIGLPFKLLHGVELFLKRNFLGVFLPAGSLSALAYAPRQIRKAGYSKMQVHQASGLFAFAGLLSVFIAGVPVIIFSFFNGTQTGNTWIGLPVLLLVIFLIYFPVDSIRKKGAVYRWIKSKWPSLTPQIDELFDASVIVRKYGNVVGYSVAVEILGMLTIYCSILALGQPGSFQAAASVYIAGILMSVISPFMRGLGAVELSMVYILERFGYSSVTALSVTLLYRVFEFWLPLIAGLISFAWGGRNLLLRAFPVVLTFLLGLINIISAVTPPIKGRSQLLREYLPLTAIHASHLLVLFMGLALLITSVSLFKGLRSAWIFALILTALSIAGNLAKALDYEEAIVALATLVILIATASQYRVQNSSKWKKAGIRTALLGFPFLLLFAFISFYFIDQRHFGEDFTWADSLLHALKSFLLVEDSTLHPVTRFGHEFIWILRGLGFILWGLLIFCLIRPYTKTNQQHERHRDKALFLLSQFGNSSLDYFKVYADKVFFFSEIHDGFIAYKISGGFAIVLEEPVCDIAHKLDILTEFDQRCRQMGLKPAFYRVDEDSIPWFSRLKKNKLIIGQEAIIDVHSFSLEGRDKKSLRNGLNNLNKKGYSTHITRPPHTSCFLAQLKNISDEWLRSYDIKEAVFSQGMFDEKELRQQDIITLNDESGNIKAFLNVIPDYAESDCTYDLIRKTNDAPGAAMDALVIKLTEYAKEQGKQYINLGLVPLTGISQPDNTAEQLIKMAADKIKRFQHYKGLREFKDKYAAIWEDKYLIYDNDFDLLQLPIAINNVMKP